MTFKSWNGATAAIGTAADWSPAGALIVGDTGVVAIGAVLADGLTLDGSTLRLSGNGVGVAPTLEMTGSTLGARFRVMAQYAHSSGTAPTAGINVNGVDTNAGQIIAGTSTTAAKLQIQLGGMTAELVNTGVVVAEPGSTIGITAGQVNNNGRLIADGGSLVLNTQMTGTGSILIERGGRQSGVVTAQQIVGSGQTVLMHGGLLELASANNFLATLQGWDSGSTVELLHTHLTAAEFSGGVLTLHDGTFTEATIHLSGHYGSGDFHFTNQADGAALVTTTHAGPWG